MPKRCRESARHGGEGQVGHALCATRPSGVETVALARRDLDITDAQAVDAAIARHRPQWIFNAAAYTAVDRAESEPERARQVNSVGPETLARATTGPIAACCRSRRILSSLAGIRCHVPRMRPRVR
jgi:nucleoside-diphosphate-sugar epimerase